MENKELKEMYEAIIKSNVLYGKTLVTVGDSITYGEDMDEEGFTEDKTRMTYGWQIANRNNMKFYNLGKSGSTMADVEGKNGFSKENGRYTQMPDQIDYLTIFFGWNDAAYGKLGTIDDTTNETYYGGFNVVLPYLIKKYPDTKICLIVPFGASAGHRQAVREVADKWGVACFDMHKSGTPFHFTKESDVKVDKEIAEFRRAHYQAIGAHPNYKGHCLIGRMLEHFLRGI